MSSQKEGTSGSDQLIEEIQSKYRSDRFSKVGKRFGLSQSPLNAIDPLQEILERSAAQGLGVVNPRMLDRESSDRLIEEMTTPKIPQR